MVTKFLDLNNLPWQSWRPEETYGVLFSSWVQSCTGKSYMSSIFVFFFFLPYLQGYVCCWDPQILLPPKTPPPHHHHTHPTCSCLYTRSRKIWYQSAYSPKCPLCICCCTKDERSAYSNRYSSHSQCLLSITVVFLFILGMFLRK